MAGEKELILTFDGQEHVINEVLWDQRKAHLEIGALLWIYRNEELKEKWRFRALLELRFRWGKMEIRRAGLKRLWTNFLSEKLDGLFRNFVLEEITSVRFAVDIPSRQMRPRLR